MKINKISQIKAGIIFAIGTIYFFLLLFTLRPFLMNNIDLNPALYWFITGYFLFIPLFITAIILVRIEGNSGFVQTLEALNIKPFSKKDWIYSIAGLAAVLIFTGLIFGASVFINKKYGIRMLSTTPWFMDIVPFKGSERLLLLIWLPMFFFNIAGEEMLWRGYIQTRLKGKFSWILCSFLWMLFHLPFGPDLLIILIPALITVPFVFSKTKNTLTGIFIHGLFNGPVFVLAALGIIK